MKTSHPTNYRADRPHNCRAGRPLSHDIQRQLSALNAFKWQASPRGRLQVVRFGGSDAQVHIAYSDAGANVQCGMWRGAVRPAASLGPSHVAPTEPVLLAELRRVLDIFGAAQVEGIKNVEIRTGSSTAIESIIVATDGEVGDIAESIRQMLPQFEAVVLKDEASLASTRKLQKMNANAWQHNFRGLLQMVHFGHTGPLTAIAYSDAGIRDSCCTLGGIIRENGEVVALVMDRMADSENIGEAELLGIARIMEEALALGIKSLEVRVDNLPAISHVVQTTKGPCADAAAKVRALVVQFDSVMLTAVLRKFNTEADALATSARDTYETRTQGPVGPSGELTKAIPTPWHVAVSNRLLTSIARAFAPPALLLSEWCTAKS